MPFEWDERKARRNVAKHGVKFEAAMTAFDDPDAWLAPDTAHSTAKEHREWLIGSSDEGLIVVAFTRRAAGSVIRIISARRAGRRDRRKYEALKRVSMAAGPEGDPGRD